MALVLAHKRPGLLTQAGRVELSESYFHPAYLVKNGILAFQEQVLNVPQAKFGLEDRPMSDIIIIDSDGEEQESHAADDPNPMLPPFKYTWENYKKIPGGVGRTQGANVVVEQPPLRTVVRRLFEMR